MRLLGLDRSQFSKTIMLAQGQFAQFLRMGPEDRTKLVKELFGAEEYEAIQDELDTKRKEFGDKVDGQRAALEERIRAARENAERIVERLESGRPSVSDSGETDTWDRAKVFQLSDSAESDIQSGLEGSCVSDSGESDTPDGQETSETRGDAWRWGLNESGAIDEPARSETDIVEQLQVTLRDVEADAQRLLAQTESQVSKADDKLAEAQRRNEAACELRESYEETQSARNRADELKSRKPDIAKQRRKSHRPDRLPQSWQNKLNAKPRKRNWMTATRVLRILQPHWQTSNRRKRCSSGIRRPLPRPQARKRRIRRWKSRKRMPKTFGKLRKLPNR